MKVSPLWLNIFPGFSEPQKCTFSRGRSPHFFIQRGLPLSIPTPRMRTPFELIYCRLFNSRPCCDNGYPVSGPWGARVHLSEGYNGTPLSSTEAPAAYSNENTNNWKSVRRGPSLFSSYRPLRSFCFLSHASLRRPRDKGVCAEERNGTPIVFPVKGK